MSEATHHDDGWSLIQLTLCQTHIKPSKRCGLTALNLHCGLCLKRALGCVNWRKLPLCLKHKRVHFLLFSRGDSRFVNLYACSFRSSGPLLACRVMESRCYKWVSLLVHTYSCIIRWKVKKGSGAGCSNHFILLAFSSLLPSGPSFISLQGGEGEKWGWHRPRH